MRWSPIGREYRYLSHKVKTQINAFQKRNSLLFKYLESVTSEIRYVGMHVHNRADISHDMRALIKGAGSRLLRSGTSFEKVQKH